MSGVGKIIRSLYDLIDNAGPDLADQIKRLGYPDEVAERIASGDLPMDESSREARRQSYQKYFHGGSNDFLEPDVPLWLSDDDLVSSTYVLNKGQGSVKPYGVDTRDFDVVDGNGANFDELRISKYDDTLYTTDELMDMSDAPGVVFNDTADLGPGFTLFREMAKERGVNPQKWADEYSKVGSNNVVVKDPTKVRDWASAAFDPLYKGPNILGSLALPAVGVSSLLQSDDADATVAKLAARGLKVVDDGVFLSAINRDGDAVASYYKKEPERGFFPGGSITSEWSQVDPPGQGIGTEFYDALNELGYNTVPDKSLTEDGAKFWGRRNPELMRDLIDRRYFNDTDAIKNFISPLGALALPAVGISSLLQSDNADAGQLFRTIAHGLTKGDDVGSMADLRVPFWAGDNELAEVYSESGKVLQGQVPFTNPFIIDTPEKARDFWGEKLDQGLPFIDVQRQELQRLTDEGYDALDVRPGAFEGDLGYEWAGGTWGDPQVAVLRNPVKSLVASGYPEEVAERIVSGKLDMRPEAIAERRASMFPLDVYHGSMQDIRGEYVPQYRDGLMFTTPNPEFAANWAGKGVMRTRSGEQDAFDRYKVIKDQLYRQFGSPEYGTPEYDEFTKITSQIYRDENNAFKTIYPLSVRANNTFDPTASGAFEEITQPIFQKMYKTDNLDPQTIRYLRDGAYLHFEHPEVIKSLQDQGFDSVRLRENTDGPLDTLAMFDGSRNVRFKHSAAFDPEYQGKNMKGFADPALLGATGLGSAGLLAAIGGPIPAYDGPRDINGRPMPSLSEFIGQGVDSIMTGLETPARGVLGLAEMLGQSIAGKGFEESLRAGAETARRPVDQTARIQGDRVFEATGSPLAGYAMNILGLLTDPMAAF